MGDPRRWRSKKCNHEVRRPRDALAHVQDCTHQPSTRRRLSTILCHASFATHRSHIGQRLAFFANSGSREISRFRLQRSSGPSIMAPFCVVQHKFVRMPRLVIEYSRPVEWNYHMFAVWALNRPFGYEHLQHNPLELLLSAARRRHTVQRPLTHCRRGCQIGVSHP